MCTWKDCICCWGWLRCFIYVLDLIDLLCCLSHLFPYFLSGCHVSIESGVLVCNYYCRTFYVFNSITCYLILMSVIKKMFIIVTSCCIEPIEPFINIKSCVSYKIKKMTFYLKSVFSDISMEYPALFWLLVAWDIFFFFILSLSVFLCLWI